VLSFNVLDRANVLGIRRHFITYSIRKRPIISIVVEQRSYQPQGLDLSTQLLNEIFSGPQNFVHIAHVILLGNMVYLLTLTHFASLIEPFLVLHTSLGPMNSKEPGRLLMTTKVTVIPHNGF
jgi:hypothetical protein